METGGRVLWNKEYVNLYKVLLDRVKYKIGETNQLDRFDCYITGVAIPLYRMVKKQTEDDSLRHILFTKEIKALSPTMKADNIYEFYSILEGMNEDEIDAVYSKLLSKMLD